MNENPSPTSAAPPAPSEPHARSAEIKSQARQLGFDLAGIAPAEPSARGDYVKQWLADGRAGDMHYLHEAVEQRLDPRQGLPGARSVICLAVNYQAPLSAPPADTGRIARYALADDYHELMKERLHALADWLRQRWPEAQTRCCVDISAILEKELAARSGIGWMGKNTCLISPQIGSWTVLGEVVTTLELACDDPGLDHCGACHRCIDACPTGAITAPYQLDARRCISYLTIEHHGDLPADVNTAPWIFGCDICQEVCPWNHRAPAAHDPHLQPRFPDGALSLEQVLGWTPDDYRARLRHSAIKRIRLPILQRNARACAR